MAISNPRNVAPLAKGDLRGDCYDMVCSVLGVKYDTYRMSVGPKPRVNAPIPSVRHTVRTQSNVEAYFWPVAGVKPSVCILDLIISIGYITAQIFDMALLRGNSGKKTMNSRHILQQHHK